jgi:alpha-1,6-mannosyltransferase
LSDDVFRFIWDGRLLAQGVDPFAHTPQWFLNHPEVMDKLNGIDKSLFAQLNSGEYYTVYPPFCQALFALAGWLFPNSELGAIISLRSLMIISEAFTIYFLEKLRRFYNQPYWIVLLYALNPLVIMELTGNLHFEGFMITFMLGAFWLFLKKRHKSGAVLFSGAVLTKLLPLIFLPSFLRRWGWRSTLVTGFFSVMILFIGMLLISSPEQLWNMAQSLDLYFQTFEFNASFYYILRWIGFQWAGYNMISTIGPLLAVITALLIFTYATFEKRPSWQNFPKALVLALTIYLALATTVHPWYITPLLAFSLFTPYWFPIVWSFMVLLSYATYLTPAYQEVYYLTFLSYLVVFGVAGYELWKKGG